MKKLITITFAAVLVVPTFLLGNVMAANPGAAYLQDGQTTGRVTVRRRHHGVVRRNSDRAYRGGKYVARKTVHGAKYVSRKSVHGAKYTYHTAHHTGRKVVSRTKKIVD